MEEGDGYDEDDDLHQQEPLPGLTTYKEAITALEMCVTFLSMKDMEMKPCLSISVQILTRLPKACICKTSDTACLLYSVTCNHVMQ